MSNNKYKVSISESGTYVKVQTMGTCSADVVKEFSREAIKKANEHNIIGLLFDARQTKSITSPLDKYMLAYRYLEEYGLNNKTRIAVLTAPGDNSHAFIETVFINAGYQCRLFTDENIAIEWLEELTKDAKGV